MGFESEDDFESRADFEDAFYEHDAEFRRRTHAVLLAANSKTDAPALLRLTQRLADRLLRLLFCDDLQLFDARLRDVLAHASTHHHDEHGGEVWTRIQPLFAGRRFAPEPALDALHVPNLMFCASGPGSLVDLSARYNFGETTVPGRRTIGLHALGRIFERSLTQPEPSKRRKRHGVYYTPTWMSVYVVEATLGRKLEELQCELDLARTAPHTSAYVDKLEAYASMVARLRILDPACGSGVLLTHALQRLLQEQRWIAAERERITGAHRDIDSERSIRASLVDNLYGVDIDPESVDITKFVLWLLTAQPDAASLDHNIRVGNSLLDEQLAGFAWHTAFPEVFARGGFDCIIGNPPYVKFQHLRASNPVAAEQLRRTYSSTKRGNFDLYIPFIERGLALLHEAGRLGVIAPSLWTKQAYGERLRALIHAGRYLERWVDFGALQVFEDATTYTALQFYTRRANAHVQYLALREALQPEQRETSPPALVDYAELPGAQPWTFGDPAVLALITRLQEQHPSLADSVASISVGVQTSADKLYHFDEIAPGQYRNAEGTFAFEHFMRRLVSGEHVKPYLSPNTTRRILFPYVENEGGVELATPEQLHTRAPTVWRYLDACAAALKGREGGKFDDAAWYRFGRNQNIDKQHLPKILIPRLVLHLGATPDLQGEFVADNVDVCYVIPRESADIWYLTGVLNSSLVDGIFRKLSKPFRGDYRSANKQYIAPLPIPKRDDEFGREIAERAERLSVQQGTSSAAQAELDALVQALYGVTDDELALLQRD